MTPSPDPLDILLIEDSRGDALLIEKALTCALADGYRLSRASTLAEAITLLASAQYHVALLDRSLPDSTEFSSLHSLQNIAPELPIIYLTAYQDEQVAFMAIEQGAQDYLFKDSIDGHIIKRAIHYAMMRKQFEGVLIARANYDLLTGLANRALFESRLEMALARMKRQGGRLAVLFLDLNGFKAINDTLGHAAGDQLIKEVGAALVTTLRAYDTAARFGGDEFAVLIEQLPEPDHATMIACKIITLLEQPFHIHGREVSVGVSIGIATCGASRPIPANEILARADAAMYAAKRNPGSNYMYADALPQSGLAQLTAC